MSLSTSASPDTDIYFRRPMLARRDMRGDLQRPATSTSAIDNNDLHGSCKYEMANPGYAWLSLTNVPHWLHGSPGILAPLDLWLLD